MSIDAFLQELFPSAAAAPANFADRFAPALSGLDTSLQTHNEPMARLSGPPASFDDRFAPAEDASLPPNAMFNSGQAGPNMPMVNPPLPRPRPAEAPTAEMLGAPQGAPTDLSSSTGDMFARLAGRTGMTPPPPPGKEDSRGVMARLLGLDATGEKRLRSTLAGGMAGGNPAFGAGAFMKGASGALTGGLKSDKEDTEAETAASDSKQKQANFNRTQTDKELTSEALRKLYGARASAPTRSASNAFSYSPGRGRDESGEEVDGAWKTSKLDGSREFVPGMVLTGKNETSSVADRKDADSEARRALQAERADALRRGDTRKVRELDDKLKNSEVRRGLDTARTTAVGSGGRSAWNKPPHERLKDVERLMIDKEKQLRSGVNPIASKAERDAANIGIEKQMGDFRKRLYKQYGFDENGNEVKGATQSGGTTSPAPPAGVEYDNEAISGAREAIARGANKAQVLQRLKDNGISVSDGDLD